MKKILCTLLIMFFISNNNFKIQAYENLNSGFPTTFASNNSIKDIVKEIEEYYLNQSNSIFRANDKWAESIITPDGEGGDYVTVYFWTSGSNMSNLNVVGKAQRKAVISKYGDISNSTEYKMETTQHIVPTSAQSQGYITISASATCYDRR